jgi:hypothetical protein
MIFRSATVMLSSMLTMAFLRQGYAAQACDSSSCALLTRGQGRTLLKGAFTADLSFRYTDESRRLAGGSATDEVVRPRIDFDGRQLLPAFHREAQGSQSSLQADLGYGVTTRLAAFVSVPVLTRKTVQHVHLPLPSPAPGEPPPDDPHGHGPAPEGAPIVRDYRSDGLGDTLAGLRYTLFSDGSQQAMAGLAIKVPTGEWQASNPNDGGIQDPTLQAGTGSVDAVLSGLYSRGSGPLQWNVSASQQIASANGLGYRFGHETILGVGVTRALRAVYSRSTIAASVQLKGHLRTRSEYQGEPVPSTGGRMIILSPGLRLTTPGGNSFYAFLQLPVHSYAYDTQLFPRSSVLTGFSRSF